MVVGDYCHTDALHFRFECGWCVCGLSVVLPALKTVELGYAAMKGVDGHEECSLILRGAHAVGVSSADLPAITSFVSEGESFKYPYVVAVEHLKWKGFKLPGAFENSNNPFMKGGRGVLR